MVGVRHTLDCKDCDCSLAVWRREAGRLSWCSPLWLWTAASSFAAVGSTAAASAAASAAAVRAAVLAGTHPGAGLASGGGFDTGLGSVWTSVVCSDWRGPVGGGLGIPPPHPRLAPRCGVHVLPGAGDVHLAVCTLGRNPSRARVGGYPRLAAPRRSPPPPASLVGSSGRFAGRPAPRCGVRELPGAGDVHLAVCTLRRDPSRARVGGYTRRAAPHRPPPPPPRPLKPATHPYPYRARGGAYAHVWRGITPA